MAKANKKIKVKVVANKKVQPPPTIQKKAEAKPSVTPPLKAEEPKKGEEVAAPQTEQKKISRIQNWWLQIKDGIEWAKSLSWKMKIFYLFILIVIIVGVAILITYRAKGYF